VADHRSTCLSVTIRNAIRRFSIRTASSLIRCFSAPTTFSLIALTPLYSASRRRETDPIRIPLPDPDRALPSPIPVQCYSGWTVRTPASPTFSVVRCAVIDADLSVFYDRAGRFVRRVVYEYDACDAYVRRRHSGPPRVYSSVCVFLVQLASSRLPFIPPRLYRT